MSEHLITQEERLEWAECDARRHMGQLGGSCFCNVCTLLEEVHCLRAQLATARERVQELETKIKPDTEVSNAALEESVLGLNQRVEQAEARERAVTKLLALHEECDDDVPCSILSDLRALLAPPAPAP